MDNASSRVNSSTYYLLVDTTAPTSSISVPTNNTTTSDNTPQITFTLTDNVDRTLDYTIFVNGSANGTGTATNNSATSIDIGPLSDGPHTVQVQSTDETGHATNSSIRTFFVDTAAPTSTILSANNTWTADNTPDISINLTDNVASIINYTVYVNGVPNKNGTATNNTQTTVTLNTVTQGNLSIVVEARDNSYQYTNSSAKYLNVDTANPTSSISVPTNNTNTSDTTPLVTFTLTDNFDTSISYVVYVNNTSVVSGNAQNNTPTSVNLTTLSQGSHNLSVQATDDAGNVINATTIFFTVDTTNPTSNIVAPSNNTWTTDTTPSITVNLTDNMETVLNYTVYVNGVQNINGSTANSTNTVVTLNSLSQGNKTIIVEATDSANNKFNSSAISLLVDNTSPTSTITSPANNSVNADGDFFIAFNLTDNLDVNISYIIYQDGSAVDSGTVLNASSSGSLFMGLSEGSHTFVVEATDSANLSTNSTAVTVVADTTDPTAIINFTYTYLNTPNVTINFTVSDNLDSSVGWRLFINNTLNASGTAASGTPYLVNLSGLLEGEYVVTVEATDNAGRAVNSSVDPIYTIDFSAPSATINSPTTNSWTTDVTPQISFTLFDTYTDEINYTIYLDGVSNLTGNVTNNTAKLINLSTLTQGAHTLQVQGTDYAGNKQNSTQITFYVDATNPSASITVPSANNTWFSDTTPQISFNITDNVDTSISYVENVNNTNLATSNA